MRFFYNRKAFDTCKCREYCVATVAQSVEQLIRNQQVAGSSPASSSKIPYLVVISKKKPKIWDFHFGVF